MLLCEIYTNGKNGSAAEWKAWLFIFDVINFYIIQFVLVHGYYFVTFSAAGSLKNGLKARHRRCFGCIYDVQTKSTYRLFFE